ncbi:ABC transporter ATP-binding protein [Myxococcota bacterium]|nr:ABC transporter ATP-binding protein [Myxococcota bacterium]
MIEVNNLTKRYGEVDAIRDVTFQATKGEILGFLGRNGAGKTTTMRILAGSLGPSGGSARVAGFDVVEKPKDAKRRLGYLPEQPPLYLDMTVRDFLAFAARIKQVPRAGVRAAVDRAIDKAGLPQVTGRLVGNLSKGYRQRVGLAQAIVHDPEVLVMDEPTEGLDPQQIIEIRELIRGLKGAHTVVLSTHILPEVQQVCDRVLVIDRGRIVAQDTLAALERRVKGSAGVEVVVARPSPEVLAAIRAVPGVLGVAPGPAGLGEGGGAAYLADIALGEDPREGIARAVVEGGFGLLSMHRVSTSLEDIFLGLIRDAGAEG